MPSTGSKVREPKLSKLITVLLADDHDLIGRMLSSYIEAEADMTVVGTVRNAEDAIREGIQLKPDIGLLDIDMPGPSCFDAARTICARSPETRIIFLSAFIEDRYVQQALDVSAAGYVTKMESPQTVVGAIRTAAAGGVYFSPDVQKRIVLDSSGPRLARSRASGLAKLTRREIDVLQNIALGFSKKQIAKRLSISVNTVDNHTNHLMTKLDIHDRVALTRWAIKEHLVDV